MKRGFAILDALQPVVIVFAIFMMIYMFLFQPHKVDGNSMYPYLHNNEYILTNKIGLRTGHPNRGDIVVFHAPPPNNSDFIKRVVGLPGETIMVKGGQVFINGQVLREPYLPPTTATLEKSFLREGVPYPIQTGYYMVFGDNRNFSSDSREWGPISEKSVVGKASFRYWPLKAGVLGPIQKPSYVF